MNRTKRRIFDTAIKLFAEKGYSETSVEEITAVTGIAKGTLYYHFSKKEDIFYFLLDEGMKLLKNSIEIKTAKEDSTIKKIRAIILIQTKINTKYEELITLILSQMWGRTERNLKCQECMADYISILEKIVQEGIEKGEIKNANQKMVAIDIFCTMFKQMTYKVNYKTNDTEQIAEEIFSIIYNGIRK